MSTAPKVTVALNTLRQDYPMPERPRAHVLSGVADDLRAQTMASDIEFVVVDGLHAARANWFDGHDYPFDIIHVPPRQTPMVQARKCAICAYKNTAIAHARGELFVTLDDCASLPPAFVERAWRSYKDRGVFLCAMFEQGGKKWPASEPAGEIPPSDTQCDTRARLLPANGYLEGGPERPGTPPMYGFASFSLHAALAVNGYDEYFDGSQGLEDVDMGVRLQTAGFRLAISREHTATLWQQCGWPPEWGDGAANRIVKCCNPTYVLQREARSATANKGGWGPPSWAWFTPKCIFYGGGKRCHYHERDACGYVGVCADAAHPDLRLIMENPPNFDLALLRHETLRTAQPASRAA